MPVPLLVQSKYFCNTYVFILKWTIGFEEANAYSLYLFIYLLFIQLYIYICNYFDYLFWSPPPCDATEFACHYLWNGMLAVFWGLELKASQEWELSLGEKNIYQIGQHFLLLCNSEKERKAERRGRKAKRKTKYYPL